jgi:hypothetical protein
MSGFTLAGGIGLGLVWGWLIAGLGGGTRGPWSFRIVLAGLSFLAGAVVWKLAGGESLAAASFAAILASIPRLAWHRELSVH